MALTLRARLTSLQSDQADFSDNQVPLVWEEQNTPATDEIFQMNGVGSLALTAITSALGSPVCIEILNKDTTAANAIRLTWTDATSATANSMDIPASTSTSDQSWARVVNVDPTAAVVVTLVAGTPAWTLRAYQQA